MSQASDFEINAKGVLTAYKGDEAVLEIPKGVKVIGKDIIGYRKGENVKKVIIPEGVTEIKDSAFSTSNISECIFPSTLKIIGKDAFSNCKNLKSVIFPEGVTAIADSAFWMSGLETVVLPDSLQKIGDSAFMYCESLYDINLPHLEDLIIGERAFTGCKRLVDETGFFIVQDRVFTFFKDSKEKVRAFVPDSVKKIEGDAFEQYGDYDIEMSIECPIWPTYGAAKKYGFARSIINRDGSTISFRDTSGKIIAKVVLAKKEETEPKENGCVLSICCKPEGGFDFSDYDASFATLGKNPNKIRLALTRLQYPYELSDEMQTVYSDFLKKQATNAGMMIIDENDEDSLRFLGERQLINASACQKLIDYAKSKDNVAITAWLLEYNNSHFSKSVGSKSKTTVKMVKPIVKLTNTETEKTVADWRKEFKFKYKNGGVIITSYIGDEECVTFPEKIGDKYVVGLGRGTFDFSTSKKVKKIIVPGWIDSIEGGTFFGTENVEIEIQEGITKLPTDTFFVVSNLVIKLPMSLKEIGEQFGDSYSEKINLIVPSNSVAEAFCKQYELSYTTYEPTESDEISKVKEIQQNMLNQKTKKNGEMNMATWKKPKAGTSLVPRYQGNETSVLFPTEVEGVKITGIANTAGDTPENYKIIKEVVIPEGYTYIGNKAFSGCENLETISLPSTIREIGTGAFAGCKKLKEIIIKKDVSFVGKNVFADSNIKVVVIETEKKTKIPSHLFFGCHIDNLIVYGGPFKSNGNVFDYTGVSAGAAYAEELYDGNFPEAVYINDDFSTLDLKGVGGGNAKKIHPLAELNESIIMNESVRSIIASEKTKKGKVVDNANKTAETTEVESIDFANSVFVLAGFDYEEEWPVTAEIEQRGGTLKDNVAASINYLVVPDRELVKNSKIKKAMEFQAKGKPISIIKIAECRKHMRIHDEKIFGIEGAKIAADYRLSIEEGNVTLKSYLGNDVDVIVPDKIGDFPVVALGTNCFEEGYRSEHKTNIKSITIPASISVIPKGAFNYCKKLTTINLSEGLITVASDAFEECDGLKEIKLPNTVEIIEDGAFSRCRNLEKIFIPESVKSVGNPFNGCDSLTEIVVAEDNDTYDSRDNCNAIIETTTNKIIAGCKNTVIPASVTVIGEGAFCGIDAITEFVVPEGIVEIGDSAFNGCMKLKSIKISDSVEKIGSFAFYFCSELTKLELPAKLTEIHISAFGNCQKLTDLVIGDALKEITDLDNAWTYNVAIKKVYGSANSIAKTVAEARRGEYIEI